MKISGINSAIYYQRAQVQATKSTAFKGGEELCPKENFKFAFQLINALPPDDYDFDVIYEGIDVTDDMYDTLSKKATPEQISIINQTVKKLLLERRDVLKPMNVELEKRTGGKYVWREDSSLDYSESNKMRIAEAMNPEGFVSLCKKIIKQEPFSALNDLRKKYYTYNVYSVLYKD